MTSRPAAPVVRWLPWLAAGTAVVVALTLTVAVVAGFGTDRLGQAARLGWGSTPQIVVAAGLGVLAPAGLVVALLGRGRWWFVGLAAVAAVAHTVVVVRYSDLAPTWVPVALGLELLVLALGAGARVSVPAAGGAPGGLLPQE